VAQVDFGSIGTVMADMALDLAARRRANSPCCRPARCRQPERLDRGDEEALKGEKYKDLKLVDVVYGNDQSEESYNKALALVDKYPDLKVIMAPTTVGIVPPPRPCRTKACAKRSRSAAWACRPRWSATR
jgi:rhamnose transport system substrate-binding protein